MGQYLNSPPSLPVGSPPGLFSLCPGAKPVPELKLHSSLGKESFCSEQGQGGIYDLGLWALSAPSLPHMHFTPLPWVCSLCLLLNPVLSLPQPYIQAVGLGASPPSVTERGAFFSENLGDLDSPRKTEEGTATVSSHLSPDPELSTKNVSRNLPETLSSAPPTNCQFSKSVGG